MGVVTAPEACWIEPFSGLRPRAFANVPLTDELRAAAGDLAFAAVLTRHRAADARLAPSTASKLRTVRPVAGRRSARAFRQ